METGIDTNQPYYHGSNNFVSITAVDDPYKYDLSHFWTVRNLTCNMVRRVHAVRGRGPHYSHYGCTPVQRRARGRAGWARRIQRCCLSIQREIPPEPSDHCELEAEIPTSPPMRHEDCPCLTLVVAHKDCWSVALVACQIVGVTPPCSVTTAGGFPCARSKHGLSNTTQLCKIAICIPCECHQAAHPCCCTQGAQAYRCMCGLSEQSRLLHSQGKR